MPFRVREQYKASPQALIHPGTGMFTVPDPRAQYPDDDPLVAKYGWYFIAEGQAEAPQPTEVRVSDIEQATRAPGEKRTTPRRSTRK
jgi:hypothetical protein